MIFLTFDVRVSKSKFEQVVFELLKYIPTLRIIAFKNGILQKYKIYVNLYMHLILH